LHVRRLFGLRAARIADNLIPNRSRGLAFITKPS
jgi:hypothetical protein